MFHADCNLRSRIVISSNRERFQLVLVDAKSRPRSVLMTNSRDVQGSDHDPRSRVSSIKSPVILLHVVTPCRDPYFLGMQFSQ